MASDDIMENAIDASLKSSKLWSRVEVLTTSSQMSKEPGIYGKNKLQVSVPGFQ